MDSTMIKLDLAKSVLHTHGVDRDGRTVLEKKLHRGQMLHFFSKPSPCLIGVELARRCITGRPRFRQWAAR